MRYSKCYASPNFDKVYPSMNNSCYLSALTYGVNIEKKREKIKIKDVLKKDLVNFMFEINEFAKCPVKIDIC